MISTELPIQFGVDGLVPAVITDARSGDVLMIGFMNNEALATTRQTGLVHFWSRSRAELWQKGGTSGHIQEVVELRVNCDLNALLIEVRQIGAVCHDGYETCFYRTLDDDNSLSIIRERQFDPLDVYGSKSGLDSTTQLWWGAFEWLRDHDLTVESSTSRRLRGDGAELNARIADELRELAGVVDGSHVHTDQRSDLNLEGTQVCYWLAVRAIHAGLSWNDVRPDKSLASTEPGDRPQPTSVASLLNRQADVWAALAGNDALADLVHESFSFVAAAIGVGAVDARELITRDLHDLRSRAYLADYFLAADGTTN